MSKVSVVVPIYNAGKKLEKCITSVINQTFKDIELILVNDGSTDNSLDICYKFSRMDKRIILINKNNEGCIATRRKGVITSSSEYVMFVDADDWIDKNAIEILYNEAIHHNIDITVCNMYKVIGNHALIRQKNESRYFKEDKIYNGDRIKNELAVAYLHGYPFPANLFAKLYKRELLITSGNYLERICFLGEDLYYNLEMLLKANRVKIINKPLYYYRVGGTTSKYMSYLFDDMVNGYEIQKEVIEEYYQDSKQRRYNGISVMLLNTFKTCLTNLFYSGLDKSEIKNKINEFVTNNSIRESLSNKRCQIYFEKDYLDAIAHQNTEFLYKLGKKSFKRERPRKLLFNILSKVC
ncbi:glycosyltransferase [Bacillus sp. DX1.1]|uniref:glycosyltransferase family 2 protein n=1 Tax=unclassified Bacillus (in: firmicutes) TaxID=185979 RepID=UPI0025710695|nr:MULTISPECIES: glycosyltransferase [unclassified Bacillus (in: firmicutes)]MDM5157566.1 glycosyltransferase [Bacillus sp. DX1.1]WJE81780.1 glycosyltransferase [Bacillus sp. DX3.1]